MRRLNSRVEQIAEELVSDLADYVETEDTPWRDVLAVAMNDAWDKLEKAEPTGEPDPDQVAT